MLTDMMPLLQKSNLPLPAWIEIFKYSPIPTSLMTKISQIMQQAQQQPNPQQQMQQQMAQGLAQRMATRFSPRMAPRFQAWRRMLPQWMVVKAPSMPWSRLKWRKPSDRMQGALVVGLALMALSTVLTFWMQPESFKSAASASSKPTRAAVTNPAATGLRPVALRMDAQ